jgi:hypothetical protein
MSTESRLGTGSLVIGTWHASVAAFLAAFLGAGDARAADFEVTGDIAAQGYEVASPFGDQVLGRRRLMTTLGLAAYNLQGEYKPFAPDYSIQLRMRLDADFGVDGEEEDFDPANPGRFVPGYDHTPVDLMYGYVEGRNLLDGWLTFRVGRQYTTDVLGWWNFDGGLVRLVTPFYISAEVFGGLEQRGGLPLSTSRWESQGVWRGSGGDIENNQQDYPSFQSASQAPAFGAALESFGPNWIKGRLVYRRVYNLGETFTGQFPAPGGQGFSQVDGLRLSSDRIGYSLSVYLAEIGGIKGGFAYDLYNQLVSKAYGSLDFYPHEKVALGAELDFFNPTYDADSIWNWFTHSPITTALGRVALGSFGGFEATASGGARLWLADGDPETYATAQCQANNPDPVAVANCLKFGIDASTGNDEVFSRTEENRDTTIAPDLLGNVGARYRWSNGFVAADAMLQTGFGDVATNRGNRYGGSVYGKQDVVGGLFWIGGRVSAHRWFDPMREARDAASFSYVVAPELFPWEYTKFRVEWEHDMNPLVGQRFRLLGYITLRVDSNLRGGFGSSYGYLGNAI